MCPADTQQELWTRSYKVSSYLAYSDRTLTGSHFRLGIAFAQPPLIQILTNTKAPYNISAPTAHLALAALAPPAVEAMQLKVATLTTSRLSLKNSLDSLSSFGLGTAIGGSVANFLVVPILNRDTRVPDNDRAFNVYRSLAESHGVVVRYRGSEPGCQGCLRITIGSEQENAMVLQKLREVLETT